jgi:hypothetical protein
VSRRRKPIGTDDEGRPVTADEFFYQLDRAAAIERYNDIALAWALSENGLLLLLLVHHWYEVCRPLGLPMPGDLLAVMNEVASQGIVAAQKRGAGSAEIGQAMRLSGGAKGHTAYERALDWVRKVKALRILTTLTAQYGDKALAADRAGQQFGYAAGVLLKDHSRFVQKHADAMRTADPWQKLELASRPLPKKRVLR